MFPKKDLYQEVTEEIILLMTSALETGSRVLWNQKGAFELPKNLSTKKPYQGINVLTLWASSRKKGFSSPFWLTFKQAADLKGSIKKGEKGTAAIFFKPVTSLSVSPETGNAEEGKHLLLKAFSLFNFEQTEGLEGFFESSKEPLKEPFQVRNDAQALMEKSPVPIKEGGFKAFYSPSEDRIFLPLRDSFISPETFYAVAFHEMIHSTGLKTRLNRKFSDRFGDDCYAMEELVAELGAAFLCAEVSLFHETREDHAYYLKNWLSVLKKDKKAIFTAAAAASKAASFILSKEASKGSLQEEEKQCQGF